MPGREYVLMLALHAGPEDAAGDLADLLAPAGFPDAVAGAAILQRGRDGTTIQQPGGGTLAYGIGTGAAVGVAAGALLGVPLQTMVVGAAVGGLIGHRRRRDELDGVVAVLADHIPIGATALVAVVAAEQWPVLRTSLARALRVTGWPLDEGPLVEFARSLVRGNPTVSEDLSPQGDEAGQ